MAASTETRSGGGRKRKCAAAGLPGLHDDMLERVLARLPPASFFRLRAVSRRWRAAAGTTTFRAACAGVPKRDPWLLMLSDDHTNNKGRRAEEKEEERPGAAVFDSGARAWARWRGAPTGPVPVASAGGLVLYRDQGSGELTVANPLTGATRALPPPPAPAASSSALHAVAMYGTCASYRVVLLLGDLPEGLSMACFDSSANKWDDEPVALARQPSTAQEDTSSSPNDDDDGAVYFLSKSGDVVAPTMHRNAARQYASAVATARRPCSGGEDAVAYFLSPSGTVVACDVARRAFAELPRVLPAYHEYSIDVVACDGAAAYVVVLSEFLGAASLRVWEFDPQQGTWRQVAAMPPAMSQPFFGAKADVNCVGHGDKIMVCVTGEAAAANGCFMCDVKTNSWEELPPLSSNDGEVADFVAAVSFEPRMEAAV